MHRFRLMVLGPIPTWGEYTAIEHAAVLLHAKGFETMTMVPALDTHGRTPEIEKGIAAFRLAVTRAALTCDGLALMEGWLDNRTARETRSIYQHIGMPAYAVATWLENGEALEGGKARVHSSVFEPVQDKGSLGSVEGPTGSEFVWFGPATERITMPPTRALPTQGNGSGRPW